MTRPDLRPTKAATTPEGYRAYAVGDIHGRLDLLDALLAAIERDNAARPPSNTLLVFLGDLIDRGPSSRQVIERLLTLARPAVRTVFLSGNHEEVLLRLLAGETGLLAGWLQFGGSEFLRSYGIRPSEYRRLPEVEALARLKAAIPPEHATFLGGFADTLKFGNYLFVHAGIRPGTDLALQSQTDMRWIRQPFLDDDSDHGFVVVHGHTIASEVVTRANRIGIDTGAYRSGVLTALGLEGTDRWIIATAPPAPRVEPAGELGLAGSAFDR